MNWFLDKAIVVPVDYSEASIDAVKIAMRLASSEQQVHVIHVIPDLRGSTDPRSVERQLDYDLQKLEMKKELGESLSDIASDVTSIEVGVGDPGHTIVGFAEQIGAGLIVMPSHGRRGISRVLLGSVAERVVRLAHCPVMILKSSKETKQQEEATTSTAERVPELRIDDLLEVYSTSDRNYAEVLKNSLHSEGIKCEMDGESQGGFAGLTSFPIKLLVRAEDYDRARKHIVTHDPN